MAEETDLSNFEFKTFKIKNAILLNRSSDPDINFYNDEELIKNISPLYYDPYSKEITKGMDDFSFSIFHINIRSLQKFFESLKQFRYKIKINFQIICLSETWCQDKNVGNDSYFQIPNYNVVHQIRDLGKEGGGLCMFIKNSLLFKFNLNLSSISNDYESLCVEIINKASKNIVVHALYRPPSGKINAFEDYIKNIIGNKSSLNKSVYFVGDINLNILDYDVNKQTNKFFNTIFQSGYIPLINKPTRVTNDTATSIDQIITNEFINTKIKTGIFKTDISDHFPIFIISNKCIQPDAYKKKVTTRIINDTSLKYFHDLISRLNWNETLKSVNANEAYDIFLTEFLAHYNEAFPKITKLVKSKTLSNPWITKGILKSSKIKQRLYCKFLKKRTLLNETNYKSYKRLFESVLKRSKKNYYSEKLNKNNNTQNTWNIIKEVIGKKNLDRNTLPTIIKINNNLIVNKSLIAETLNNFFVDIGTNLASKIGPSQTNFRSYLTPNKNVMTNHELTEDELLNSVSLLKPNKSSGVDDVSSNVIIKSINFIKIPLLHIFNLSLKYGVFPENLKIAKVTPIYKTGDPSDVSNYRPISVLTCFSKILERVMYKRLYSFLTINNILYDKQFGFKSGHSTNHAIIHLVHEIFKAFDENKFTLGVFIDLSKAFDTVDHNILLHKLKNYGVVNNNLLWFKIYLTNRKQYISFNDSKTDLATISCGVPQGSILGPLLFLIYLNDLSKFSNILNSILFADDTNLFYSNKDINYLFETVNKELAKLSEWFIANKLSINIKKTKYTFFHRLHEKRLIPLNLPNLVVNNSCIVRERSLLFLGVVIDENVSWKEHIIIIHNKISKNIGLLYKAKQLLNQTCLKYIYFSFIHSYLSYANVAWCSTNVTKIDKLLIKQKHALRIIGNVDRFSHTKPLFIKFNILNVFQLNLYQILIFMFKVNKKMAPTLFNSFLEKINHLYPTRFSENNYIQPKTYYSITKFSIANRGPKLWNTLLNNELKTISSIKQFKNKLKQKLLINDKELNFF